MNDAKYNGKKTGKIIYFIGIGIVLILLMIAEFISRNGLLDQCGTKPQVRKVTLKYTIRRETEQYLKRNRELFKEFETRIASVGNADFEVARKNIPAVARQFSSITWNGKLCYKMAKDRLCKSKDTQAALDQVLAPRIIAPCERGNLLIRNELETFLLRLAESENQFHARLALIGNENAISNGKDVARPRFLLDCHKISEKMKSDAKQRTLMLAGMGLEIIFLRETIHLTTAVFQYIVIRLAATGTTAGICAAADGPFPIGDAIGATLGIGSLAWCAYDLYHISQVMPGKMRTALFRMVDEYQGNSRKQALEFARKHLTEYQNAAEQITQRL